MERAITAELIKWKDSSKRKPLILKGARQTGKTYLLKEFGRKSFAHVHYINFEKNKEASKIFEGTLEPLSILDELSLITKKLINIQSDIVIFDEIQDCPKALTSLKYFNEEVPRLAIACAGSHMGLVFSEESFPVGKVEFLFLFPMSFEEFLREGKNQQLIKKYEELKQRKNISENFHTALLDVFKKYIVTGGLPEIVKMFLSVAKLDLDSFEEIRKLQNNLLNSYVSDFTKHSGKINSLQIQSTFYAVAKQIAQSQDGSLGKFKFKNVQKGRSGYRDFRGPIEWLKSSGLVIQVPIVNRSEKPLGGFTKENFFKLYFFDIGLLGAILDISFSDLYSFDFGISKGAFFENFVAQELSINHKLYGWTENTSEIEFLRVIDNEIVPIEVKSATKFRARSLEFYIKRYHPKKSQIISFSTPEVESALRLEPFVEKWPMYLPGDFSASFGK